MVAHRSWFAGRWHTRAVAAVGLGMVLVASACGANPANRASGATSIKLVLGLKRDQSGLSDYAMAASTPGATEFGHYLGLADVGARFGASADTKAALRSVLSAAGVETVEIVPAGGYARVALTTDQAESLFGTPWVQVTNNGSVETKALNTPAIPESLDDVVTEIVGYREVTAEGNGNRERPVNGEASVTGCQEAKTATAGVAQRYGMSALHSSGITGAGMEIALVSTQEVDGDENQAWATCFGRTPPVFLERTDAGGLADTASEDEITLDMTAVQTAAPGLTQIRVVQVDSVDWVGDGFAAALNQSPTLPDAISSSVVYCEKQLSAASITLADYVFATAAAVGVTVVAATGDTGNSACYPPDQGTTVAYPASSPFVTAVGGTQAPDFRADPATAGVVWSDPGAKLAGGGGVSAVEPQPAYQAGLGIATDSGKRAIPDVSAVADPNQTPPIPDCAGTDCVWTHVGGTSYAAPLVAGGLLLLKQSRVRSGQVAPALWNPTLYQRRQAAVGNLDPAPGIVDVVQGNNALFGSTCCRAGPGYDQASGWGTPRFNLLASK